MAALALGALGLALRPGPLAPAGQLPSPGYPPCTFTASPGGSDAASGSGAHAFRTVKRLLRALRPGDVGCLDAGVYQEDVTIQYGGRAGQPLTLRSTPGQLATIRGRFYLAFGADYTTVEFLNLDGRSATRACAPARCPSPTVNANYTTFAYDDVTNAHTAICFDLGNKAYGVATGTLLTRTRIHGCGVLPAQNHDHGIYLAAAHQTRITFNLIYDNADRGIQLYPQAVGTVIEGNVIAGNGQGIDFSGLGNDVSKDNLVSGNIIVNSWRGYNVTSFYGPGDPIGTNNRVVDNCIGGGARANGGSPMGVDQQIGFEAINNVALTPQPSSDRVSLSRGAPQNGVCGRILHDLGPLPASCGVDGGC